MIHVHNTMSRTKEPFETVEPGKVGMYLCGPTVYKPSHIGHMVGPVIFDTVKRYLTYSGYDVTFVINITDVDDKLINESNARGIPMAAVASEMTEDYMRNLNAMGVDSVDHFPAATEHMDNIIRFTNDLVEKDFAYESEGDVYFDVAKFPEYGKLSGRTIDSVQGEGGGMASRKRNPQDFALWKKAKDGEPSWESPWGPGRPGWHIECSVMSREILGETFDIHGGGLDLMFPHHENEVAQSECRHGVVMAKFWMHNGLMAAASEVGKLGGRKTTAKAEDAPADAEPSADEQEAAKISKSTGASAFRDMLVNFSPESIRFFLLSTHYRRPIAFSEERIREVETGLEAFYRFFKSYERVTGESFYSIDAPLTREAGDIATSECDFITQVAELRGKFLDSMDDDFNTGGAVGELFDIVRALNKYIGDKQLEDEKNVTDRRLDALRQGAKTLRELGLTLGLFRQPIEVSDAGGDALTEPLIALLIELRANARKAKDFATGDLIRDRLAELGIVLEDRAGGTEWTRA